jgi:hypothetical protein
MKKEKMKDDFLKGACSGFARLDKKSPRFPEGFLFEEARFTCSRSRAHLQPQPSQ